MKKKNALLLISLCVCLALAACSQALAEGDWGELTGEPEAGAACSPGDEIVYCVTAQKAAEEETFIRVTLSGGVIIEEEGFVFTLASQDPEHDIIWGKEGCVLIFPALVVRCLLFSFVVVQEEGATEELCCNVIWAEETLTLTHALAQNPAAVSPSPTPKPEDTPAQQPGGAGEENGPWLWVAFAALVVLPLGAAALIVVRRRVKQAPKKTESGLKTGQGAATETGMDEK